MLTVELPLDTLVLASCYILLFGAYMIVGDHNVIYLSFSLYNMLIQCCPNFLRG